jgi:hypothetical protein
MSEEVTTKSFSLRKSDIDIIETYTKQLDGLSDSATLRQILREWATFKGAQLPLPMEAQK